MSKLYSPKSAAVSLTSSDQLQQRHERAVSENPNLTLHTQHRRHNSLSGRSCGKTLMKSASITDIANKLEQYDETTKTTAKKTTERIRPEEKKEEDDRTKNNAIMPDEVDSGDETRRRRLPCNPELNTTKDCLESSTLSYDEPDLLQHRFSRTNGAMSASLFTARHAQAHSLNSSGVDNGFSDLGCTSGMSSVFSSPSASTVSSPLSSPTRQTPHFQMKQHQSSCCSPKSIASVKNSCSSATSANHPHHHHYLHDNDHHHHQQHLQKHHHQSHQQHKQHQPTPTPHHHMPSQYFSSSASSGSKNVKKFDPRLGPSPYRQLLPIALCILSFATVFSILIVYMDTTEIRHQQFRLNMSRDDELYGVAQDDPTLIAFLREIQMCKYPNHIFKTHNTGEAAAATSGTTTSMAATSSSTGADQNFNFSAHPNELTPKMAYYVSTLLKGKTNGAVIQSITGSLGHLMTAPWLAETLNWAGTIVEPETRRFFTLRKQNVLRPRLQVVHACVSPNPYPKEVTIHNEESEVRINSLLDEETSWFNPRVKCFPLYTIMLASNRVEYDLLSLGVHGHELEILQTLPFEKIKIEIISIHLMENQEDVSSYVQTITQFLQAKSYKLQKKFGRNYFYQRLAKTNSATTLRTRIKDILELKTP